MAKLICENGDENLVFLGAAEPKVRGARGVYRAVIRACQNVIGEDAVKPLLERVSSIVTDGASVNTGEKNGLWALFDSEIQSGVPKLKIWCAVHRSQLAWQSVTDTVAEVSHLLQSLAGISTYFHTSGLRTRELKDTASENSAAYHAYVSLPRIFEVRWTEFTHTMANAVLVSWYALVLYFKKTKDRQASGFLSLLTSKQNLELLAFVADVLFVFSRFQKKIQGDGITIINLHEQIHLVKRNLSNVEGSPLLGGWVSALENQMERDGPVCTLRGIELSVQERRRKGHHLYVTDRRDTTAVQHEIILSLTDFLEQRFSADEQISEITVVVKPFVSLDPNADVKAFHEYICPDLDLMKLDLEYRDLVNSDFLNMGAMSLSELTKKLIQNENFSTVVVALARILAAKPHSADVERLISTNNILKSNDRMSMSLETENLYLYVHHNMPDVEDWDARPAVSSWLQSKSRRNRDRPKVRTQPYFSGVFKEATKRQNLDENNEETVGHSKKIIF